MIQILKDKWVEYKKLETYKQVLLFLPIIILAVFCITLFFWEAIFRIDPKTDRDKHINSEKYHKKHVNKQIELNKVEQAELKRLDEDIKKKQYAITRKLEENYERTKEINSDLDNAISSGDADKLKRIHAKLNDRSRRRQS